ncbi:MAG: hypothetical protein J4G13_04595 [Dehalococcoidia bacterium]|nr:hypothetical protein [Dehalococcoidia bacterium]
MIIRPDDTGIRVPDMTADTSPTSAQDHVRKAWDLVAESDRKFAERNHLRASALLWEATVQAVLAVVAHKGWDCQSDRLALRMAVERLAEEEKDDLISLKYIYAENFRDNADSDFMELRTLAYDSAKARDYVRYLIAVVC